MANRPGRNDPCPCGSGKKYKKCCLGVSPGARPTPGPASASSQPLSTAHLPANGWQPVEDDIDIDSNRVVDLIDAGDLDAAERQCHLLRDRYPDMIDWLERLAQVYEARGQLALAVDYYRRAAAFAEQHRADFDPELIADFHRTIAKLDDAIRRPS